MAAVSEATLWIYGILLVVGGIIGYAKAHSVWSLGTGIVTGILMFVAFGMVRSGQRNGYMLGGLVAVGLAIFFLRDVLKTHKFMPGGGMFAISVLATILIGIAVVGRAGVGTPP